MPKLKTLSLGCNKILTGEDFYVIAKFQNLETCKLFDTKVRGSDLKVLQELLPNCEFSIN